MKPEILIAIVSAIVAIISLILHYFGPISDLKEKIGRFAGVNFQDFLARMVAIETKLGNVNLVEMSMRLVAIETKLSLFWDSIGSVVKDIIKQPTHVRKDELVDKFPDMPEEEIIELKSILTKEMGELKASNNKDKVLAWALMIARINTVCFERKINC